jgi:hypothetical protein
MNGSKSQSNFGIFVFNSLEVIDARCGMEKEYSRGNLAPNFWSPGALVLVSSIRLGRQKSGAELRLLRLFSRLGLV